MINNDFNQKSNSVDSDSDDNDSMSENMKAILEICRKKRMQQIREQQLNIDLTKWSESDLKQLHMDQIDFILNGSRLFKVEDEEIWYDFFSYNPENCTVYKDLSTEQLKDEFITNVLPNLHRIDLTDEEKKYFSVLNLHPFFKQLGDHYGYRFLNVEERVTYSIEPKIKFNGTVGETCGGSLTLQCASDGSPSIEVIHQNANNGCNQLIATLHRDNFPYSPFNTDFGKFCQAILSFMVSDDLERLNSVLLDEIKIKERLSIAKANIEDHGNSHITFNIEDILSKLKIFRDLHDNVCKIMNNNFN